MGLYASPVSVGGNPTHHSSGRQHFNARSVTLVAPKDANRPAIIAHMNKGFANELSAGLVAHPAHGNLIENTLCSYLDLDIDRFDRFGPF